MSRQRGIGLTILVAIISSMIGSLLTLVVVKDDLVGNKSNDTSSQIVVDDTGKDQNIYHAVTNKAMPSVVGITTTTVNADNYFQIPTESQGVGTGVIVDSNGYILTNSHVVSDNKAVEVNVLFNDGTTTTGKVLWNDAQLDLAMVKVEKAGLVPAELGDSDDVRSGDIAIAIGNPLGLEFQKTVTQGIISGLNRTIQTEQSNMTDLIQTDASINPGNSGGPLLNDNGQVIGINTAKVSEAEGLGFAIPINIAKPIIEEVINTGNFEKVTIGIKGVDVAVFESMAGTKLDTESGVYVLEVTSNSAAQKSGVQAGDIIVKIGDSKIETMSDLTKQLYEYSKGDNIDITVNRNGKEQTINISF